MTSIDPPIVTDGTAASIDAVHRNDGCLFEWRRIKRARRMALMMFRKDQLFFPVKLRIPGSQLPSKEVLLEELLAKP